MHTHTSTAVIAAAAAEQARGIMFLVVLMMR